jgi:hypothetical protein
MGAAIDDDEVSKEAADVISTDGIKSAYGKAIEDEVLKFYNLVNHEDDALEPGFVNLFFIYSPYSSWNPFENQPVYYPFYEQGLAIGQKGIQSSILDENRPINYLDINMQKREIPIIPDDADADGTCDLGYPIWFSFVCTIHQLGDNHLGYVGFRGLAANSLKNNGAIDIVVHTIRNPP